MWYVYCLIGGTWYPLPRHFDTQRAAELYGRDWAWANKVDPQNWKVGK